MHIIQVIHLEFIKYICLNYIVIRLPIQDE